MHILFLAPHYSPDLGPSAPLFEMLSEELVKGGHTVTVVAAVPHYPTGTVSKEYRGFKNFHTVENGVEIIRVALPSVKRSNLIFRFFQFLCYQIRATFAIFSRNYDVLLAANPSLWVWLPFFWSVKIQKKPAVYSVFDIYPDVGVALGIFRHRPVIKAVTALERFCLHNAKVIHILAESFRPALVAHGVEEQKMHTIDVWVDISFIHPAPKKNAFSQSHNLTEKFVLLYAGNIGFSQGLETIIEAAQQLTAYVDIQFVLVGEGNSLQELRQLAEQNDLHNILFMPFQPRPCLPDVLASADVCLVSQRKEVGNDSIPSKVFSIMASNRPILACVEEDSEARKLIQNAQAGICVPPEQPQQLVEAILKFRADQQLCEVMGGNGRFWVEKNHSPKTASEKFEILMHQAIDLNHSKSKSTPALRIIK